MPNRVFKLEAFGNRNGVKKDYMEKMINHLFYV